MTDKKSFLEKRIHEQAVETFYALCSDALEGLGKSVLGELRFKGELISFPSRNIKEAFEQRYDDNSYPHKFIDAYLKANFEDYESFKAKKIEQYEKEKTDQILDEIGGLTELLRNER